MIRVTSNMLYNNNLYNIFQNNQGMLKAQEEVSTGRRINRPSDDPCNISKLLRLRSDEEKNKLYLSNIEEGISRLNFADSALDSLGMILMRAKEIAVGQATGTSDASTRSISAVEVEQMLAQIFSIGNTSRNGQYIFAGKDLTTQPFSNVASGAVYNGSSEEAMLQFFAGQMIGVGLDGSQIMSANLNPDIGSSTLLSSLNGGTGIGTGSINITDRAGNSATVNLSGASTIGDVINSINGTGLNITASINSSGNGIAITDNSGTPISNLTIAESGGNAAANLGILSDRASSNINGLDLNAVITNSTSVSNLKGGSGLSLGTISIINGSASGAVTLSGASTVADIISAINSASSSQGLNVTASINASGTAIQIDSNDSTTVAYATEVGTGTTASDLGLGGGVNIIRGMSVFKEALEKNDIQGISGSIDILDRAIDHVLSIRADVGARVNRLESADELITRLNDDTAIAKANIEDADLVQSITDLSRYQAAYEASLQSSALVMQTSLLDFIR